MTYLPYCKAASAKELVGPKTLTGPTSPRWALWSLALQMARSGVGGLSLCSEVARRCRRKFWAAINMGRP